MTVKELITELESVENKDVLVYIDCVMPGYSKIRFIVEQNFDSVRIFNGRLCRVGNQGFGCLDDCFMAR